ncbi:MAG: copper amine oxidase N-terminal domain-containing protein [Oscillospiraceae bacterium]|nr:copper amine oxidase N-terminal domain-containing protein [Oscillospiraceae bacterium]
MKRLISVLLVAILVLGVGLGASAFSVVNAAGGEQIIQVSEKQSIQAGDELILQKGGEHIAPVDEGNSGVAATVDVNSGSAEDVRVEVNGVAIVFPDQQPFIENDRTYIPVRFVVEALLADVVWEDELELVTITRDDVTLSLTIGDPVLIVNEAGVDRNVEMDVKPILLNDRTMIPIRFVAEALGCAVDWIESTNTVTINDDNASGYGQGGEGEENQGASLKSNVSRSEEFQRDREIYTQFLLAGGYDAIISASSDTDWGSIEIESCMVDLDNDGTHELLISLMDTDLLGVWGYPTNTAFLSIRDGKAEILVRGISGGGTMGGDFLLFKYDSLSKKHALVLDGVLRDGYYRYTGYTYVYSFANGESRDELSYIIEYINTQEKTDGFAEYLDEADKIRNETSLYYEEGDDFYYYIIDDQIVSKDEYSALVKRFVDVTDDSYTLKPGSYDNPIL